MTDAVVYYFSGSGNSFAVARDIADGIDAELISIAAAIRSEKVKVSAEVVGIVFPDYQSSLPNIVKRFINKVEGLQGKYVFGVCTYGGAGPGLTMRYLEQLIESKDGKLAAGFAVSMPYNYIIPSIQLGNPVIRVTLNPDPAEKQRKKFSDWKEKLETITDFVNQRKEGVCEIGGEFLLKLIDQLKLKDSLGKYVWLKMAGHPGDTDLSFSESWRLMDHGFSSNENCVSCGTCEKICPVDNVVLINGKPSWQHNCEQCFACLQWCPQSAIQYGKHTENDKRYHHPSVKPSDLMFRCYKDKKQ